MTDEAKPKHVGNQRECYCFGAHGRGEVTQTYTDGAKCRGPLSAQISPGKLMMRHSVLRCTGGHGAFVASDIQCDKSEGSALCQEHSYGRYTRGFSPLPTNSCHFLHGIESSERWNDGVFGDVGCGGDDGASGAGEVVAVGFGGAFDEAEMAQPPDLA